MGWIGSVPWVTWGGGRPVESNRSVWRSILGQWDRGGRDSSGIWIRQDRPSRSSLHLTWVPESGQDVSSPCCGEWGGGQNQGGLGQCQTLSSIWGEAVSHMLRGRCEAIGSGAECGGWKGVCQSKADMAQELEPSRIWAHSCQAPLVCPEKPEIWIFM